MEEKILENIAMLKKNGTGSIVQFDLHTVGYDPMRAARHIPLPKVGG